MAEHATHSLPTTQAKHALNARKSAPGTAGSGPVVALACESRASSANSLIISGKRLTCDGACALPNLVAVPDALSETLATLNEHRASHFAQSNHAMF
jgi:hypothetical protein